MGKNGSKKQKYYSSLVVHVCSWPDLEECSSKDPLWRCCCARLDLCIERGGCFGFVCVSPSCLNACRLFLCAREVVVVLTNAKVLRYKKSFHTPLSLHPSFHHGLLLFVLLRRKRRRRLFVPPRTPTTTTPVGFFVVVVSSTRDEEQKRTPCCDTTSSL